MNVYVDIDETICDTPKNRDYASAVPIKKNIKKINDLYDEGNTITYWTARGTLSGQDWSSVTKAQFEEWGVKHHNLMFGKPAYDILIDDKAFNAEVWMSDD